MIPAFLRFVESGRDPAAVLYSVKQANERGLVHPFQNGRPSDYDCAKMLVEIRVANELERVRLSAQPYRR
jgi:hypothetical protein